jgi:uncharacterized protein (DUF2235 family)
MSERSLEPQESGTMSAVRPSHRLAGALVTALSGLDGRIAVAIGVALTALVRPIYRWGVGTDRAVSHLPSPDDLAAGGNVRNHVICLDGTFNSPEDSPTNVWRLFDALSEDSGQIKRYYRGVGMRDFSKARSAIIRRLKRRSLTGGGTGLGRAGALGILLRAYFDFVKAYRPGDRIFIFGFSRGAAIARALANYICKTHGLPDWVAVEYLKSRIEANAVLRLRVSGPARYLPPVEFVGLWDTVASMPERKDIEPVPFDLSIPHLVNDVCHLVAIHERRGTFDVELIDRDERIDEIWFPGWHSNVGGGSADSRLSNITLRYMMSRAAGAGLRFTQAPEAIACEL